MTPDEWLHILKHHVNLPQNGVVLDRIVEEVKVIFMTKAIESAHGNRSLAATKLRITLSNFRAREKRLMRGEVK